MEDRKTPAAKLDDQIRRRAKDQEENAGQNPAVNLEPGTDRTQARVVVGRDHVKHGPQKGAEEQGDQQDSKGRNL